MCSQAAETVMNKQLEVENVGYICFINIFHLLLIIEYLL